MKHSFLRDTPVDTARQDSTQLWDHCAALKKVIVHDLRMHARTIDKSGIIGYLPITRIITLQRMSVCSKDRAVCRRLYDSPEIRCLVC